MTSSKKNKSRADELVLMAGLAETKSKAQALIMAGEILCLKNEEWIPLEKAGQSLPIDVPLKKKNQGVVDVGRGAQKLRGAFKEWPELEQKVRGALCLDIGSSTGGFTQVLLEKGAKKVVALDVGTHQLHEKLRSDPRVLSLEQTHILKVQSSDWLYKNIALPFDMVVMDVSFISATKIFAHVAPWMRPAAPWIVLVKPQFELDRARVPKGVVRDEEDRQLAIQRVRRSCEEIDLLEWRGLVQSPIQGSDGNIEYLAYIVRRAND
jgi:23S rRNA (cytidine1920-2'-O)/16S rRNA (cytidine1409-2'-O)-methyltransferase